MGQFIETQNQLVSEAKQARQERQQEKTNKKNIELLKNKLKLVFLTCFETSTIQIGKNFYNFNNSKEIYLKLLDRTIQDDLVYQITPSNLWENTELMHKIDNIYMSTLIAAYKPYKEIYKDQFITIANKTKEIFKQEFDKLINEDLKEYEKNIILKYNELKTLDEKSKYIEILVTSDLEGHYIEDNYYKILEKVYTSYLNDLKAKKNIKANNQSLTNSDWDRILSQSLTTSINQFEQVTGTKWGQNKDDTNKKIKKNGFIAFLNMILK